MKKSENVIFTIVAKNYLSLARTLRESVLKTNLDVDFKVFVVDELHDESLYFKITNCEILNCSTFISEGYEDMAYKYDITEFNTAVKPFCFKFLKDEGYSKAIYFDPDIYVYSDLNENIFNHIGDKLILITPHYVDIEEEYTGVVPESLILFVGVVNMGFCCINLKHAKSSLLLDWWSNRLRTKCYADKLSGYHTDQKWIDFVPYYFPKDTIISQDKGLNVSIWNLHERKVEYGSLLNDVRITNRSARSGSTKLTFFHFSGFDPSSERGIHKYHKAYSLIDFPDLTDLIHDYRKELIENGFYQTTKWEYSYNKYSNGRPVTSIQRRIYRRLLEEGKYFQAPFSSSGGLYQLFASNQLISKKNLTDKLKGRNVSEYESKLRLLYLVLKFIKKLLGVDRYALLLRVGVQLTRPENQLFLLKGYEKMELLNDNSRKAEA